MQPPNTNALVPTLGAMLALSSVGHAQFGPGAHWLDTVPAMTVAINVAVAEFGIDTNFDNTPDVDARFVGGPTIVHFSGAIDDSANYPGLAFLDGHLDIIDVEVLQMSMTGTDAATGWVLSAGVDSGLATPSLGAMSEVSSLLVNSFFNVFFKIDGTPWGTIHNNTAVNLSGISDQLPAPWPTRYVMDTSPPIPLYDSSNTLVGNLTLNSNGLAYKDIPEPAVLPLLALAGLTSLLRRRK